MVGLNLFKCVSLLFVVVDVVVTLRYNDTCLPQLGLQINHTLANPWGTNDQLIRDIYVYFEELDGVRKEIQRVMEEGQDPKTIVAQEYRKYLEVNETGGPAHLQSLVNIRPLINFYKWDKENIAEFYELLQFTREAWTDLQALFGLQEKRPVLTLKDKIKLHLWDKNVKLKENTTSDEDFSNF